MYISPSSVNGSRANVCTFFDRGDVWPSAATSSHRLPDFSTLSEGLLGDRLVATDSGWRRVDTLQSGDRVLTFDNGMRRLESCLESLVQHDPRTGQAAWGLSIPKGALGNRREITLLPDQRVLFDCDYGQRHYGDSFILVPASLLEGYKGIKRTALPEGLRSYMLGFATEEIVHSDGSALLACYATRKPKNTASAAHYPCVTWAEGAAFRATLTEPKQSSPQPGHTLLDQHLATANPC